MNVDNAREKAAPAQLERRTLLKGITLSAGAVVLQPFLSSLRAQAAGKQPSPRIIFLLEGNGLWPYHIHPKGLEQHGNERSGTAEKLTDLRLADYELPEAIAPLTPFKDRMAIIKGVSHKIAGAGDHGKAYGGLGCFHWRRGPAAQTVDHALAETLGGIIPVVGLGLASRLETPFINSVSAKGPKRPLSMICQPELAFRSLFGSVAEGSAAKAFRARNKLLDWIRSDIRRVRRELPAMDREKLDVYLDTFEAMRTRQDKVATIKERLKDNEPAIDRFNSELETDRFEALCEIAAAVIASGMSNVLTLDAAGGLGNYHTWRNLGVMTDGHAIGHMHPDDPQRDKLAIPIRQFHAERIAALARRLDSVREGDGTVLDNTLIVWMSDSGEEHHGFCDQWPMVIVGDLGGRLKTAGRYLQYPKYNTPGHRTMANFYLALLHAVGDRREKFGEPDPALKDIDTAGPLAEILA